MPATGQDVADRANVSKMTVSRVLRGRKDLGISAETRDRVLTAARELDYRPNVVARSFRSQRTNTIGFFTSEGFVNTHDPFFVDVVAGMRRGCSDAGKRFLLFEDFIGRSQDEIYSELTDGQIDGGVGILPPGDPLVARLAASSLPVVAIADSSQPLPSVVVDDRMGSWLAAEYLARKGHKRILYRRYSLTQTDDRFSVARRYTAFCEAASKLGMSVMDIGVEYEFSETKGFRSKLSDKEVEYLNAPSADRPTAIVCYDDFAAHNLLVDCSKLGIRVPEDLAIVGFDGCPAHLESPIRLTTIRAGWADVVRKAVSLVIDLQEGRDVAAETVMPVELFVGDTA